MIVKNNTLNFRSSHYLEFKDITNEVVQAVNESKIKEGQILVYSTHTTVAICINEKEKGFFEDFKVCMSKLIPKEAYYKHNDLTIRTENLVCDPEASDCLNGHSHCSHLLMRNSEMIPIINGKLVLGTWQRVFAIELDCMRKRKIILQVMGI